MTQVITTDLSTGITLAADEGYFLAEGVTHFTANGTTLTADTNTSIFISGTLLALNGPGVDLAEPSGATDVEVVISTSGSLIAQQSFVAIFDIGDNALIINNGAITGGVALRVAGDNVSVSNTGLINGTVNVPFSAVVGTLELFGSNANLQNSGIINSNTSNTINIDGGVDSTTTVTNSGELNGVNDGIRISGTATDSLRIVNTGLISATGTAVESVGGAFVSLLNSGTIVGDITLADAADTLRNSGEILGDVSLGLGADVYRAVGDGAVSGRIDGGAGADFILGGTQNDTIFGGNNNDTLQGGAGDDSLEGGLNNDLLLGGIGNDELIGDAGNDTMFGNEGNDDLSGQSGRDRLSGNEGDDTINGGSGIDTIFGGAGDDEIIGGEGIDTMNGGAGEDTFVFEEGDFGAGTSRDRIIGFDAGEDVIDLGGQGLQFGGTSSIGGGQASAWIFETPFGSTLLRVDFDGNGSVDGVILLSGTTGLTADDIVL